VTKRRKVNFEVQSFLEESVILNAKRRNFTGGFYLHLQERAFEEQ
jgi:hypothetical protein